MKEMTALPERIRKEVRRTRFWKWVLTLLWVALWAVGVWRYYAHHPASQPNWMLIPFAVAVLALPFWMFRFGQVFDRSFEGEIVKIKYRMMSDVPVFSEGLERVERHETAILYVRPDRGGKKKLACPRLWRSADRCYAVGDRVKHIPMVALPKNLSKAPEGGNLCLVCGVLSPDSHETCAACGRPLF